MTDTAQPRNPNERSASEHNAGERTLEERRAALKALMAAESTDVQEYHAVITGATEEERASLARTLTPKASSVATTSTAPHSPPTLPGRSCAPPTATLGNTTVPPAAPCAPCSGRGNPISS